MSQFQKTYNPNRNVDWNYGGTKWRLSRSKIDLFVECPRCFYLDNKLGTGRPRGPAFTLNVAVDALLKKEFDVHRAQKRAHPLMETYHIDAIPFEHDMLDIWRENFKGLEYHDKKTGFRISGAVDDIWINPEKELIVVDYKATSKTGKIVSLADSAWEEQYARQIGVYQWLLSKQGFVVSPTGYFVYANAYSDKEAFDAKLEFDITVVPCTGDGSWIEPTINSIKECLDRDTPPSSGDTCEFCAYREAAGKKLQKLLGVGVSHSKQVSLGI